jgi:hypothetical protein
MKLVGVVDMDFDIINDLLIKYGALVKYMKWRNWNRVGHTSAMYRLKENL